MISIHRTPRPGLAGHSSGVTGLLFAGLFGALFWRLFLSGAGFFGLPEAEPRQVSARGELLAAERSTIDLFEGASPSVVHISTTRVASRSGLFGTQRYQVAEGTGSGFLWDESGHVVTNFHVVRAGNTFEVRLNDHSSWKANLVGTAPDYDLAVLRIDAPPGRLRPLSIGLSRNLRVGQSVFAIGNPFGLDQTLTTGVISGLDREILSQTDRSIQGVIQTDAAINPGNSGGPLLDSAGRLIGVNTAIATSTGQYAGVGFAVPVDTVNRVVPQLIRNGRVVRPAFGIRIGSDMLARSLGIEGVVVAEVFAGSAAERAGMQGPRRGPEGEVTLGDVIVGVDGEAVREMDDLFRVLELRRPGDVVDVTLSQGEELREVRVTLQALR